MKLVRLMNARALQGMFKRTPSIFCLCCETWQIHPIREHANSLRKALQESKKQILTLRSDMNLIRRTKRLGFSLFENTCHPRGDTDQQVRRNSKIASSF